MDEGVGDYPCDGGVDACGFSGAPWVERGGASDVFVYDSGEFGPCVDELDGGLSGEFVGVVVFEGLEGEVDEWCAVDDGEWHYLSVR